MYKYKNFYVITYYISPISKVGQIKDTWARLDHMVKIRFSADQMASRIRQWLKFINVHT